MAEFVAPLRKEIQDNLTRRDMQNTKGLHEKGLADMEKKGTKTVLKSTHLILHSSTRAFVIVSISTAPNGGFQRKFTSLQV